MAPDTAVSDEANRLYWETDTSVAGIAESMQLSRRALYDVLRPLPTGATCASCGGEMVFENRSARSANQPVCAQCGRGPEDAKPAEVPEPVVALTGDPHNVRLGAAMVVGAILGAVATLIAVPRR